LLGTCIVKNKLYNIYVSKLSILRAMPFPALSAPPSALNYNTNRRIGPLNFVCSGPILFCRSIFPLVINLHFTCCFCAFCSVFCLICQEPGSCNQVSRGVQVPDMVLLIQQLVHCHPNHVPHVFWLHLFVTMILWHCFCLFLERN
jgi:hypothetical protein